MVKQNALMIITILSANNWQSFLLDQRNVTGIFTQNDNLYHHRYEVNFHLIAVHFVYIHIEQLENLNNIKSV